VDPRPRIAALLEQRWERQIITVVAGAGFGKSTALAEVRAASADDKHRHDIIVALTPECSAAVEIVRVLGDALGCSARSVDDLVGALAGRPGQTCLMLDDLHHVGIDSDGLELLRQIVRRLPSSTHLVVSSRHKPPLPLARARAANQVLDITDRDLAFSSDELLAIADQHGLSPDLLAPTEGWPALVSLTVQVGHHGAVDFLIEEVLDDLSPKALEVLTLAVVAGEATPELVHDLVGVDSASVCDAIPLIATRPDGTLVPHDIWRDTIERHVFDDDRQHLLLQIADHHRTHGNRRAALAAATATGRASAISEVIRDIGELGHVALDLAEVDHWLRRVPTDFIDSPEGRLLQAISARSANPISAATKQQLEETVREFENNGAVGCQLIAMCELGFVLRSRGEVDELVPLVERFEQLATLGHAPARHLGAFFTSVLAERDGDIERALTEYDRVRSGDLSDDWISLVETQRARCLLLLGRPREAYESSRRASELAPSGFLGGWIARLVAQWSLGVTREVLDQFPDATEVCHGSTIDLIQTGARLGALEAMAGRLDRAARNIAAGEAAIRAETQPEMAAFVDWAKVIYAMSEGDTERARRRLRRFLEASPLDRPLTMRMISRYPAIADHLVEPDERAAIRAMPVGPWQQDLLTASDALDSLRAGRPVARWISPPMTMCALPLPQLIELAIRAIDVGDTAGRSLLDHLGAVCDADDLRQASHRLGPELSARARGALDHQTAVDQPVTVRVLGPLMVEGIDDEQLPPLRRQRVREALALLALDGPVTRDRLADTLWPEHAPDKIRANLRTTLSHLGRLRAIDGERLFRESVRGLELRGDASVDVDDFERLTRAAADARRVGANAAAFDHFERALALVRGTPLDDIRGEVYFDRLGEIWTVAVVTAASEAAELALTLAHHDAALRFATLAVHLDQYHEPAHRSVITAYLELGDRVAARAAAQALRAMLDDFGVDPEPATATVLAEL
jgi:DNA-binding SARP family transcriptional activator